jgi:amino acid adenylation domain-containing protein/non-ribosomal peptide synthase protein (TIGR01720 family)
MKILTEEEIVQKYNSYLPVYVKSFAELLDSVGISRDELDARGAKHCVDEDGIVVPGFNKKLAARFPAKPVNRNALRILLLDLSQFFGGETGIHYDPVEPPLGLLYILTCLDKEYGPAVNGKIAKSRFDFDNYNELKQLLEAFKPDIIGARSLTFYSHFFHKTIAAIRNWGIDVPIIAGGPYTTSKYKEVLQDLNIDLAVIGEGEVTFARLVGKILENSGKLPDEETLKGIPGLAFIPGGKRSAKEKGTAFAREVIMLDEFEAGPAGIDVDINRSFDLAYAMFTSGSTGKPKGTLVEHANVVNLVLGLKERIYKNYEGHLEVSMLAPYVFDASVQQLFGALLQGHTLHIVPEWTRADGPGLLHYYKKNKIDISDGTPTHIRLLLESTPASALDPGAARFIIGGEALPQKTVERFLDCFKTNAPKITNVYGPTECCVDSTSFEISKENIHFLDAVPIGKPMPNEHVYILDKKNRLQPVGIAGELCISGDGAARGYLNRPELTAEKFLFFSYKSYKSYRTYSSQKIYKTGDLARWLPDGNIEFIGRMDHQVKIKGHRIELGEIENRLLKHDKIKEAIVITVEKDAEDNENESKDSYLCAYIISEKKFAASELREYLQRDLPDYMIPLNVVQLDRIPLTANGKVNRNALPAAEFTGTAREYAAPTDEVQEALVETWQQVLGIERIGIDDNFFELGGDSIKSIQISARLQERRLKLKISGLFSHPTIRQLSGHVEETGISTPQGPVEGEVVLTPIQRYFFESNFTNRHHFNHSVMLYKKDGLDENIIHKVFMKIVEHHDALRMVYRVEEDRVIQVNRGPGAQGNLFHLEVIDCRGVENLETKIEKEAGRIQGSIDLQEGPLVKLGLFKTKQGDHLLIVIHHLVVDGVSWRILLEDLAAGYRQVENNEKIRFPEKTISFKYWAEKLEQYAESKELSRESDYWRAVEETGIEPLPGDFHVGTPKKKLKYCDTVQLGLNEADTLTLLKDVNQAYNTEINDILLAALGMAIKEWGAVEKVAINLEGHGREEIIEGANISRTVGWFTSQFPVILDMKTGGDLSYVIKSVKETLRRIPNKGIGYGILRYLTPAEKREGLKFKLEPEISFNYLGQFGQEDNHRDSIIRISGMNAGDSTSPGMEMKYALNVNGILVGRELELSFSYNTHEYKKSSIRELVDCCKINLLRIIRHCAGKEETESTPGDLIVDDVELSLEDLDNIKELVELNIEE